MAYIGQAPTNAPLTSSDIQDGVIVAADLAPNSVDSSELVDGSIDTSHLSSSLTLTTPNLGTPSAGVVTNLSGVLPVGVTGGSGLTLLKLPRNEGLVVKYVSATTVDIDADFLTVFDTNNVATVLSSINLTTDITASGVNGLDTGTEAAVWYHIWVIYNGTTTASLLSASATTPTMPSGYTYKKYVGAVYNPSSSFRDFHQIGNDVTFGTIVMHGSANNGSYLEVDISPEVPTTATEISGNTYAATSAGTGMGYVGAYMASNWSSPYHGMKRGDIEADHTSARLVLYSTYSSIILTTPQRIAFQTTNADIASCSISSYRYSGVV
jgi:hypothetical protein